MNNRKSYNQPHDVKYINGVAWKLFSERTTNEDGSIMIRIYWRRYNAMGKPERLTAYYEEHEDKETADHRIKILIKRAYIEGVYPLLKKNEE